MALLTQEEFDRNDYIRDNASHPANVLKARDANTAAYSEALSVIASQAAQIERLENLFKDGVLNLKEVHMKDGKFDASWEVDPTVARMFIESFVVFYKETHGGENYLELTMSSKESDEAFNILIQRAGKKTPAQVNTELRAELERVKGDSWVPELREMVGELTNRLDGYATGDAEKYLRPLLIQARQMLEDSKGVKGGWIPCSERLPEKRSDCSLSNTVYSYGPCGMAWTEYDYSSGLWYGWEDTAQPTHWQPLPSAPSTVAAAEKGLEA